jgi:hypothetical protein
MWDRGDGSGRYVHAQADGEGRRVGVKRHGVVGVSGGNGVGLTVGGVSANRRCPQGCARGRQRGAAVVSAAAATWRCWRGTDVRRR